MWTNLMLEVLPPISVCSSKTANLVAGKPLRGGPNWGRSDMHCRIELLGCVKL